MKFLCAIFALLLATGCFPREEKRSVYAPGEPHDIMESSGKRVLVRDAEGATRAKLRLHRDDRVEVYDSDRDYLGEVVPDDATITLRRGRVGEALAFEKTQDAWTLDGVVRVEAVTDGWAVFDPENELLGYVSRVDDEWERRTDYSGGDLLQVEEATVRAPGSSAILTANTDLPPSILLALSYEELDPLAAVALGSLLELEGLDEVRSSGKGGFVPATVPLPDAGWAFDNEGDAD